MTVAATETHSRLLRGEVPLRGRGAPSQGEGCHRGATTGASTGSAATQETTPHRAAPCAITDAPVRHVLYGWG